MSLQQKRKLSLQELKEKYKSVAGNKLQENIVQTLSLVMTECSWTMEELKEIES